MNQMPSDDRAADDATKLLCQLTAAREGIARIDAEILALISQRQAYARQIGELKRALHRPVVDGDIERRVLTRNRKRGRQLGLSLAAVQALTKFLMELAKNEQAAP